MKLEVELNEVGMGKVVLDGVDISNGLSGVSIDTSVGNPNRVRLEALAPRVKVQMDVPEATLVVDGYTFQVRRVVVD